jgi:beta-glucosidase-like glycosyl hydrolase
MGKTLPLKDDAASDQTALEAARTGIVLLKNQDHLLPLKNIRKLLVVGPNGGSFIAGGGSSLLAPTHEVSLIDGLKALYPGAEINYRPVLLYSFKDKLPEKELKAFARIFLKKGGHKQVTFQLNKNSFSYYQEAKKRFGYNNDKFDILIASSSQDIRLQKTIQMRHAQ